MKRGVLTLIVMAVSGCGSVRVTDPPQTATLQFLQTVAAQEAIRGIAAQGLEGHRVYVRHEDLHQYQWKGGKLTEHAPSPEQKFMVAELRARLMESGVRLAHAPEEAQIVLDVWSGGLGEDRYDTLMGIPATTITGATERLDVPLPRTPELVLYKNRRALGLGEVAFIAYWTDTGEVVAYAHPGLGIGRREDIRYFIAFDKKVGNIPTMIAPNP
jgi:hypothetical protein